MAEKITDKMILDFAEQQPLIARVIYGRIARMAKPLKGNLTARAALETMLRAYRRGKKPGRAK